MTKKKSRFRKPTEGADSAAIHGVITAMMKALGRGGLTWASKQADMTPSAMKKRLSNPTRAYDEPSLKHILLVAARKFENAPKIEPISILTTGQYEIHVFETGGQQEAYWRVKK